MWIQVRRMDGKQVVRVDGLSKLTKIEDLRERLVEPFEAPTERQRLFYRGKQLEDGHSLFEYNVGLNEIVQIMVRAPMPDAPKSPVKKPADTSTEQDNNQEEEEMEEECVDGDSVYKIGDIIDCRFEGAWYEAKLLKITRKVSKKKFNTDNSTSLETSEDKNGEEADKENNKNDLNANVIEKIADPVEGTTSETSGDNKDDGYDYKIIFEGYEEDDPTMTRSTDIRPRARNKVSLDDVKIGDRVMVNYNAVDPEARGYWYDAVVTSKHCTRTIKELTTTVFAGTDLVPMENCEILFPNEIFKIEKPGTQLNEFNAADGAKSPEKRKNAANCDHCNDNERRKCKHCGCHECGKKENADKTLLCDECDSPFHIYCLDPPLDALPDDDEWYCPLCKNDANEVVRAGEKLKESKKKSKMASANTQSSRDWGRGMACVGRTKVCSIVPPNHFGPVPGIEVGTLWKYRVQVSEAGIHRPHVSGIAGRGEDGCYSVVLSGGYEDDEDFGDEFTYTGSGGRDLSGNKRTADQSCDQELTRFNRALARNCNCKFDAINGGTAKDWQAGKPIRVVRNCKGAKHSKYAPEEGNRYDGIYKLVKYWPKKGKSGFRVWRYLMRRDDPIPAPWTKAGKKRTEELGLTMQYPEGYEEKQAEKEEKAKAKAKGKGKGKRRRSQLDSDSEEDAGSASSEPSSPAAKKKKVAAYKLAKDIEKLIEEDTANEKVWEEALSFKKDGAKAFHDKVEELFCCICCQDLVLQPITTVCSHNICKDCLVRSFKAEVYSCPACRGELGEKYSMATNKNLSKALLQLFPGYENGR